MPKFKQLSMAIWLNYGWFRDWLKIGYSGVVMHLIVSLMLIFSFFAMAQTRVRENVKQVDPTVQTSQPVKSTVPPAQQNKGRR